MNFDERLKKGNELIKNIDLKLGKGVISNFVNFYFNKSYNFSRFIRWC